MKIAIYCPVCILCAFVVFGCAINSDNPAAMRWKKRDVVGLVLSLNDPIREEWYKFNSHGDVSVTYGEKDGKMIFPLYSWRIRNGILEIVDEDRRVFQRLKLVSESSSEINAIDQNGKVVVYSKLAE